MGGAHSARGNTNVVAEFNIATDPEAAAIVLESFPRATMVSWELSLDYAVHLDQFEELHVHTTPTIDFFNKISQFLVKKYREWGDPLPVPDPLAVAVAVAPDLIQESAMAQVGVELHGTLTRGQTVTNWRGLHKVNVVLKIDAERFWRMMLASLGVG
jgi:purine nucleosidase